MSFRRKIIAYIQTSVCEVCIVVDNAKSTPTLHHNDMVTKIGPNNRRWGRFVNCGGHKSKRGVLEWANHAAARHPAKTAAS